LLSATLAAIAVSQQNWTVLLLDLELILRLLPLLPVNFRNMQMKFVAPYKSCGTLAAIADIGLYSSTGHFCPSTGTLLLWRRDNRPSPVFSTFNKIDSINQICKPIN
jgi:hypothetical protein